MESADAQPPVTPEVQLENAADIISKLPPGLKEAVAEFVNGTAKAILAQQTSMDGDASTVSVRPDQVDFYKRRFGEIASNQVLNPHSPDAAKPLSFSPPTVTSPVIK